MLALTRLNHAKHHEKLKKTQKNTKKHKDLMKFQAKITKRLADTRKCDPMIENGFNVYKVVD